MIRPKRNVVPLVRFCPEIHPKRKRISKPVVRVQARSTFNVTKLKSKRTNDSVAERSEQRRKENGKNSRSYTVPQLRRARLKLLEGFGLSVQTKKSHVCAYRSWKSHWRNIKSVPKISVDSILDYIMHQLSEGRKMSGISTYLGGIGATLINKGRISSDSWKQLISSPEIQSCKAAARKREDVLGIGIKQVEALNEIELQYLCQSAQTFDEITLAAVLVSGFYNLHRISELVVSTKNESPLKRPCARDVEVNNETITYVIRSQKMRQFKQTKLCLHSKEIPKWAFNTWKCFWEQRSNSSVRLHPDLFVKASGEAVTSYDLNKFLSKGYRKLSSHCLRAGGATKMLIDGASLAQICAKGRWACVDSLLRYLRRDPNMIELLRKVQDFWGKEDLKSRKRKRTI